MGLEGQIGSLEAGKKADLTLIRRREIHAWPQVGNNPYAEVVYEHRSEDVDTVLIDGNVVLREGHFAHIDGEEILQNAQTELTALLSRTR